MIIFGFSKPVSKLKLGSWIIRLVQGTDYSHTYVKWLSRKTNLWMIYQATGKGGVNFISEDRFSKHSKIVKEFAVDETEIERANVKQFFQENSGDDYGYLQLLGIGWAMFVKWCGGRVDNPFPHGMVCSELVANILATEFKLDIDLTDLDVINVKTVHDKLQDAVDSKLQGGRWTVCCNLSDDKK